MTKPSGSKTLRPADLLDSDAVIIDTETTGVDTTAQIIQLAAIDMQGNTLFDSLFRPTVSIHPRSTQTHGMTARSLVGAPLFKDCIERIKQLLVGHPVIAYNVSFDSRMLRQTLEGHRLDLAWLDTLDYQCAMRIHAEHLGKKGNPKLEGGDHTALGDCLAVLKLLRDIATPVKPAVIKFDDEQLCPPPSPRMLAWIKRKLEGQEERDGKAAPAHFHRYIEMAERANRQVVKVEIVTEHDWERLYKTCFEEEEE